VDILIGVLCATVLIGLASLLGMSLDRARAREHEVIDPRAHDDDLFGEF
jgi:uncharacterized protein YqfA (UPF0365 family)